MIDILSIASSRLWLITPNALQTLVDVANREGNPEALATRLGRPLDNARTVEKRGNVAVVPVTGPLFRYANMFTQISGATSTQVLATDIQAALDDPSIKAIVLNVDSPGGEATGINELAQMIFDARGTKPITAYIGGLGASAAYWIASAADSIVIDQTAMLGSIGVVTEIRDTAEADAKSGKRTYTIVSSNAPNKRPDASTDAGRAQYQALVDELATVFVQAVARNRGTDTKTVAQRYGAGGMLVGQTAIKAGMADRLGSLESVIASATNSTSKTRSAPMHSTTTAPATTQASSAWDAATESERQEARALVAAALERKRAAEAKAGWARVVARHNGISTGEPQTAIALSWQKAAARVRADQGGSWTKAIERATANQNPGGRK